MHYQDFLKLDLQNKKGNSFRPFPIYFANAEMMYNPNLLFRN